MRRRLNTRSALAPVTRQSRLLVKAGAIMTGLACALHLMLGADPVVVLAAGLTVILTIYPLARYGFLNLGAVLIFLVGFRYVGFPIVAKLAFGQALDTYLLDPAGSFGVMLLGVMGYLAAFWGGTTIAVGRPLLRPTASNKVLGRISFLGAFVGITANLAVAFRAGEQYSGVTVGEFFVPFLHLALISGIARAVQVSGGRRTIDAWVVILLIAEIAFAMVRNSRMALMETLLCFVATSVAFEYRIKCRQFAVMALAIGMMALFLTPVFLYVRSFRGDLSWTQRIYATLDAVERWPNTFEYYLDWKKIHDRAGWQQNYYGSTQNTLDRMSHVNNADMLKTGADRHGHVGFEDLALIFKRVLPRFLAPDKPTGYSQGHYLFRKIGVPDPGPYPNAPLIGTGYVAFGWAGAFCYPLILGLVWLLVVKKISGWDLRGNIWAIYMLLRVHNQFVEGSSDAYVLGILRHMPQDFILLWLANVLARGRFLYTRRKKEVQFYGR